MKILKTALMIMLLAVWVRGAADLNLGIDYSGYYSDNIFLNASAVEDFVSRLNADINLAWKTLNIYLETSAGVYAENPEFNSLYLEPGIEYMRYLKGRDAVYLNLGYEVLNYKELYRDFNYSGPRFSSGIKWYITGQTLFRAGYSFYSRRYPNFTSFDFGNHTAFLEVSRFFASQTTLRIQAGFNYRHYPHIIDESGEDESNGNNGFGPGQGGQPAVQSHSTSVPNLYGLLRIAQGFGTRWGVNGEVELRHNFRGLEDAETLISNAYIIYPYNDNYLWDGIRFSLAIKGILFKEVSLEGRVSFFNKDYPGIYVLDEAGEVLEPFVQREDNLVQYSLNLIKKFKHWDLSAFFSYRDNQSNDDYFLYRMLTISLGIGYYF